MSVITYMMLRLFIEEHRFELIIMVLYGIFMSKLFVRQYQMFLMRNF